MQVLSVNNTIQNNLEHVCNRISGYGMKITGY